MAAVRFIKWPLQARPVVRLAGVFPIDARTFDHAYRSRFHALHLHEYAGEIRINGCVSRLEPGTLTFSPADEDSSYDLPRPGLHWCVHFYAPAEALPQSPVVRIPLVSPLGGLKTEAISRFTNIARLYALRRRDRGDSAVFAAAASIALQELLAWAGTIDRAGGGPAGRTHEAVIDRLFDYVDRHLAYPIRAEELAAQAGLTQNYLARKFRQSAGVSLPRYVLTRRIAVARLLLESTNLLVKQIAVRVGMPDPHYFNKQFRAITGTSPTACRAAVAGMAKS